MFNDLFDESGLGGSAAERQAIAQRWHQLNASVAISLASNIAAEMEPTISITTVTGDGKGPKANAGSAPRNRAALSDRRGMEPGGVRPPHR
jgi:hypothetical protein